MTTHKILCPLDFSMGSQPALHMAIRLAREQKAELVVMHVWYVPQTGLGDFPFPRGIAERIVGQASDSLDGAVQEARAAGVTPVTSRLVQGVPGWAIVDAVDKDPAIDLVVVGTHGRTGLARVLVGSIAEYIVRHAPCAVLVARPNRGDPTSDQCRTGTMSGTRSYCGS
jgi:nucleotide-binding universal stress UspA family protein